MTKYSKKVVKRITDLISSDSYTIAEICSQSGINIDTFYDWKMKKPEFSEAIEKARQAFDEMIVVEAKKSLAKKVKGYTVQEKKVVMTEGKADADGKTKPKIKEQTVTDKHFQPDTGAIIFVLTNKASDEYKNRLNSEITGKNGKDLIPARVLTKEEAKDFLKNLDEEF